MSSKSRPVFLLLDDDTSSLRALGDAVDGRYGRDYQVVRETSAVRALRQLEALKSKGVQVAVQYLTERLEA